MEAELRQLRAERDATLKAQRVAHDLRDEYETLLVEVEREKNKLMVDQMRTAEEAGEEYAVRVLEQLQEARMSCGRRAQREQTLEQQLAKTRMSCLRHKNKATMLEEETEMISGVFGQQQQQAPDHRLQAQVKSLKEELEWAHEQTRKAWDSNSEKNARLAEIESQNALLTSQLSGLCIQNEAEATKTKQTLDLINQRITSARLSINPLASLHDAEVLCTRYAEHAGQESARLKEKSAQLDELEMLQAQAKVVAAQRDQAIEDQIQRCVALQEQLTVTLEDKVTQQQKALDLELELEEREKRIVHLSMQAEHAAVAIKSAAIFEEQKEQLGLINEALAKARMSTARRDAMISDMEKAREEKDVMLAVRIDEIDTLKRRCEEAEEEARNFFLAGEEAAELREKLDAVRMSSRGHREHEATLQENLYTIEEVGKKLEEEHKEYIDTLSRELKKETTKANDEIVVLENELKLVSDEKKTLRDELIGIKVAVEEMKEEHHEEVLEMQQKLKEIQGTEEDEKDALKAARLSRSRHIEINEITEQKLASLELLVSEKDSEKAAIQRQLRARENELSDMQAYTDTLKEGSDQMEEMQMLMAVKEDECDCIELEAASKGIEVEELKKKIAGVEEDAEEQKAMLKDKSNEVVKLKKQLQKAAKDVTKFKKDAEKAAQKHAKELRVVKQEKAELEGEVEELQGVVREKGEEVEVLKVGEVEKRRFLKEEAARQREELAKLKKRGSGEEMASMKDKVERLMVMNTKLKRRLQEKQREVLNEPSPSPMLPIDATLRSAPAVAPPLLEVSHTFPSEDPSPKMAVHHPRRRRQVLDIAETPSPTEESRPRTKKGSWKLRI